MRSNRLDPERMARELALGIGREVTLARARLGLTITTAARLASVAPETQRRIEAGDPTAGFTTACKVAGAVGLRVWSKAFPAATPSLRDTGQLLVAEHLTRMAHPALHPSVEHRLRSGRAIDVALFGPEEIIATEIERLLADWQAQFRSADAKRAELADAHQRPVRLVIAVEDTRRNRAVLVEHATLIRRMLPAGTREILAALRAGAPLGRDGLLWVRRHSR
jgi:DNA-binding XRE family transcriptional regulator